MSAGLLAMPYGALSQLVAPVSVLAAVAGILWLASGDHIVSTPMALERTGVAPLQHEPSRQPACGLSSSTG